MVMGRLSQTLYRPPSDQRSRSSSMKKPGAGPGLEGSSHRAPGLGDAADLLGVLVRLILDDPACLISDAQRHLGNPLVGVDHLLKRVTSQITLNRYEILHRAGARNPVHRIDVLLQTVLNEAESLL